MKHTLHSVLLSVFLLSGCQTLSPIKTQPLTNNYGAASTVAITRHSQYQLWDKGMFSVSTIPQPNLSSTINANSDRLSFDSEGDAIELLAELARIRGLQFNYSGVRLPLPISLHVRGMSFENILRLIESQTAWRATIKQHPGLIHIAFMQQGPSKK
ncbi:DotD/TraH family lipoprotein [Pectobacterium atrosepticum]|uniref:DotD/TraH family lipoprotein n=1 Tax=Pectobacterium atrosepticum TaxID=29471 RepID=UPI00301AD756